MIEMPTAPVKLDGFPTCAGPNNDRREVAKAGDLCALCGGAPASMEIIRRSMHRQIGLGLKMLLSCETCREIPPNEPRCQRCSWTRGAMMGMAGIGEQVWGQEEFDGYLRIVGTYFPGWQKLVKWS